MSTTLHHHNKVSRIFALVSDYINSIANVTETVAQFIDNTTNIRFLHSGEISKIRAAFNPTHATALFLTYVAKPRL